MADTGKTIGLINALASVDPEAIKSSVDDWLDDHPEATTTVEDGAITKAKLDSSLQQTVDDVGDLKSTVEVLEPSATADDVGKALIVETVSGGKVTQWRFGDPGTLTNNIREKLLACFRKVAWIDQTGAYLYGELYDALYEVTYISLDYNSISFSVIDDTFQLTATTNPEGAPIVWASSDTSIATVDQTGLVTAKGYGNATITATAGELSATCSVAVAQATVSSLSASYTQTETVYSLSNINVCKSDLTVTALWSNGQTTTLGDDDYTLTGTLSTGTSTVTANYGGKTVTFSVTVSALTGYDYIGMKSDATMDAQMGIMTTIDIDPDCTLSTSMYYTNTTQTNAIPVFGARRGSSGSVQIGLFVTPSTSKMGYWYAATDTTNTYNVLIANQLNTVEFKPVGMSADYPSNVAIEVNGTDYNSGSTITEYTFNNYLAFFRYTTDGETFNTQSASLKNIGLRIGRTTIRSTTDNSLHNDFIPASDGTHCGLFDVVANTFYYNATYYTSYECGNYA